MIDHEAVRLTLRNRLLTVDGVEEDLVAWENRSFEPPDTELHFREHFIPDDERQIGNDRIVLTGTVQYDVVVPLGSGTEVPEGLARKIGNAFKSPQSIVGSNVTVVIDRAPEIQAGRRTDLARYQKSVFVYFRVYGPAKSEE